MTINIPNEGTLTGNPKTILRLMQETQRFTNSETDGDGYIDRVTGNMWRFFGVGLQVTGETYEERAESFLRELDRKGFITITEED